MSKDFTPAAGSWSAGRDCQEPWRTLQSKVGGTADAVQRYKVRHTPTAICLATGRLEFTLAKSNEADLTYPGFFGCEATIADLLEGDLAFSTDSSSSADAGGETAPSSTIAFALTSFP